MGAGNDWGQVRAASRRVRADAEAKVAAAHSVVDTARRLVAASQLLLAAAELDRAGGAGCVAHAIFDIGDLTASRGVTLCDLLAEEEVVLLPELRWQHVPAEARCPVCERATREPSTC